MLVCNPFWGTFESCCYSVKALCPLSSLRSLRPPAGLRLAGGVGFAGKSKISNHDLLQGKPLTILSLLSVIGAMYSVHGEHCTFKKLGHAVFSSDLAHLSVPINITQLAPLMTHAQYLTQHLHTQAKTHGNQAGSFLYSLATYANENFLSIHAKYENILYFYTRHVSRKECWRYSALHHC